MFSICAASGAEDLTGEGKTLDYSGIAGNHRGLSSDKDDLQQIGRGPEPEFQLSYAQVAPLGYR